MKPEDSEQIISSDNKSVFHRVTPLSKYLAIILFIVMPFLGGYIGYTFAPEKVVEVEKVVVKETPVDPSSWSLPSPNQTEPVQEKLSRAEYLKQDYETRTGKTYQISSTSVRMIDAVTSDLTTLNNLKIDSEIIELTELPYLTIISSTTEGLIFSQHCFADKACGVSGLYEYNATNNELNEMATSELFDSVFRASIVSPEKTKIISSDLNYKGSEPNSLYLVDLETDTYRVLDTVDPKKDGGTFCTGGLGGCADIVVDWLKDNKVEVKVFKKGGQTETRTYTLE